MEETTTTDKLLNMNGKPTQTQEEKKSDELVEKQR